MGSTPRHRLALATVTLALVASGAAAAPAQARPGPWSRTPAASSLTSPHSPTTVVTPPGEATTVAGGTRLSLPTPIRHSTRWRATDPAVAEVVRLVNLERARAGCAAVRVDARLATAARLHSEDMARQKYFSHTSLDGRSPWDRIRAQGYAYGSAENIAAGYATPTAVMDGWMNSAGHKANILNCSNKAIGVGVGTNASATYRIYWTQDFGTR
jgi:uncharacterized protein YkwD